MDGINFTELTYEDKFKIKSPKDVAHIRKQLGRIKYSLKRKAIQSHWEYGYFDNIPLTREHYNSLGEGVSPSYKKNKMFTVHHIKPLSCDGRNNLNNLVPLPRTFHKFVHENIITPQIKNTPIGQEVIVKHLPNFDLIPLELLMNPNFINQYSNFLIKNGIDKHDSPKKEQPPLITKHFGIDR